jgi:hypothetical protein
VTVVRPDIAAGLPEREPSTKCALQTASGETLPILKEAFVTLTLGRRPLEVRVFVAAITDELILGLDILRAYDASVDLGRQMLRPGEEEVSLWSPHLEPQPSPLVIGDDQVIPAQCEKVATVQLESPLGIENGLAEPSPEAHVPEGLYIARTVVRDQRELPVRVLNTTLHDQKLAKGFLVARCEPVALVTQPDVAAPQDQDTSPNLQDMIVAARPNLGDEAIRKLENLISAYEDFLQHRAVTTGEPTECITEARPI